MSAATGEVRISAPKDKVWSALADLGSVSDWNPVIKKSYYVSDAHEGIGAHGTTSSEPEMPASARSRTGSPVVASTTPTAPISELRANRSGEASCDTAML